MELLLGHIALPNHADGPAGDPIHMTTGMGTNSAVLSSSIRDAMVPTAAVPMSSPGTAMVPITAAARAQFPALSGNKSIPLAAAHTVGDTVVSDNMANTGCIGDIGNSTASDSTDSTISDGADTTAAASDGTDTTASDCTGSTAGCTCNHNSGINAVPSGIVRPTIITHAPAPSFEMPCISADRGDANYSRTPTGTAFVTKHPAGTIKILIAPAAGALGDEAALVAKPSSTACASNGPGPAPSSPLQSAPADIAATADAEGSGPPQPDSNEEEGEAASKPDQEVDEERHDPDGGEEEGQEDDEETESDGSEDDEETESDEEEQDHSGDEEEMAVAGLQHKIQEQQDLITRYTHDSDPCHCCCVAPTSHDTT